MYFMSGVVSVFGRCSPFGSLAESIVEQSSDCGTALGWARIDYRRFGRQEIQESDRRLMWGNKWFGLARHAESLRLHQQQPGGSRTAYSTRLSNALATEEACWIFQSRFGRKIRNAIAPAIQNHGLASKLRCAAKSRAGRKQCQLRTSAWSTCFRGPIPRGCQTKSRALVARITGKVSTGPLQRRPVLPAR